MPTLTEAAAVVVAAGLTAAVSAIVAWLTARSKVRGELGRLQIAVHQSLLTKLIAVRLRVYPRLYSLISDLVKSIHDGVPDVTELRNIARQVDQWDSRHAILLGSRTSETCHSFRKKLRYTLRQLDARAGQDMSGAATRELIESLFRSASYLEQALRSDIGIYGVDVASGDILTRRVRDYHDGLGS